MPKKNRPKQKHIQVDSLFPIDSDYFDMDVEAANKNPAANNVMEYILPSSTDVLGSYTGMDADGDAPVQDADDL